MRGRQPIATLAAVTVGALLGTYRAIPVLAADIRFVEGPEGQLIVVPDNNWDIQPPTISVSPDNQSAEATGGRFISFAQSGISGSVVAYMLDDPVTRAISDIVRVNYSVNSFVAQVDVYFQSDTPLKSLGTLPDGIPAVIENGTVQLLNNYFVDPQSGQFVGIPLNITIGAQSDAPALIFIGICNVDALTLVGSASLLVPNSPGLGPACALRLTDTGTDETGGAFLKSVLEVTSSFSTAFSFQITGTESGGADGFAFVVQSAANDVNKLGDAGGGIGYAGIQKSVAVEFDTFDNGSPDDEDGNHVGIDVNGSINSVARLSLNEQAASLKDGNIWFAWVDYDAAGHVLYVRFSQTNERPVDPFLTYPIDLASTLGESRAYVGFTAGTGSLSENHDIHFWSLEGVLKDPPPKLVSAVSRKKHGLTAGLFDIDLPLADPPAPAGVECRTGGPTQLVLTFDKDIQAADGTADGTEVGLSEGTLGFVDIGGNQMTIALGGVPENSCLAVTLRGIIDLAGNPLIADNTVHVRVLAGDVGANGIVNILDLQAIKNQLGQEVTVSNFRNDVQANGSINILDLQSTKNNLQKTATCP